MKRIINKHTGNFLSLDEAFRLCFQFRYKYNINFVEYKSNVIYGYQTSELAMNAESQIINELYKDYIFAYINPTYYGLEGYKLYFIALPELPDNFEEIYPNLVISE